MHTQVIHLEFVELWFGGVEVKNIRGKSVYKCYTLNFLSFPEEKNSVFELPRSGSFVGNGKEKY